jgi:hypothetical protein
MIAQMAGTHRALDDKPVSVDSSKYDPQRDRQSQGD